MASGVDAGGAGADPHRGARGQGLLSRRSDDHGQPTMNKTTAGAIGALMLSGLAGAADMPPQLESCAALRRDAERLLCYDKAVAQIRTGAPEAPPPSAENMFGANSDVLDLKARES